MREKRPKFDARQRMDGYRLLRSLQDSEAALAIVDPQYRAVLDKMKYGNEGARQGRRHALKPMSDETIIDWIEEVERVLRPSGHILIWMDKFSLASGHYHQWFCRTTEMAVVDLIAWNKRAMGMGRRSRSVTEYVVVAQKNPRRAKDVWTDHGIPDCWREGVYKGRHPHAKPAGLTERLIRAVTSPGDLVVDPCAGGYGVLKACVAAGRRFVGCDIAKDD